MLSLFLALIPALAPPQEIDLDRLLQGLTPEQLLARRVTPEHLVVQKAGPAVVFISTGVETTQRDWFGNVFRHSTSSSGSGVILRPEGFIVTNYHVVAGAKRITVAFERSIDARTYPADLVSFVPEEDLALLKIHSQDERPFPTVELGTSSDLMIGERVIAIGNPYGHAHTVSAGIISGLHRDVTIAAQVAGMRTLRFDDLIQTDASINPGNSGGPLLNINGQLIGINNAMRAMADNIGFAIPVDRVKAVLEQQLISPDRSRAWLGFDVHEDDRLVVREVVPGSPAAAAGIQPGDRILEVAGKRLDKLEAYRLAMLTVGPQDTLGLRVARGNGQRSLELHPWEKADGLILERLGLKVEHAFWGRRSFVRVSEVLQEGPAAQIALQPGDILEMVRAQLRGRIAAQTLERRQELAQFLAACPSGTPVEAYVRRGNETLYGVLVTR